MTKWTQEKAREFLEAVFLDIGEEDGLVVMPRSLFEFIAQNMNVKLPEVQIIILPSPPSLAPIKKRDD